MRIVTAVASVFLGSLLLLPQPAIAFQLVDDFHQYSTGPLATATGGAWVAIGAAAGVGAISTSVVGGSLRLTFSHIGDPAVRYQVEAAGGLGGPWTVVHTYPAFTAAGAQTFVDPTPVSAANRRFLRLRVSITE